jgi:hypothetical protein
MLHVLSLDSNDKLLTSFAKCHVDPESRRNHNGLFCTAVDCLVVDFDKRFTANRNLKQEKISQQLGSDAYTGPVSMIDQRDTFDLRAAYANVEDLVTAHNVELMGDKEATDMLARGIEIGGLVWIGVRQMR